MFNYSDETCTTTNKVNDVVIALPSLVWAAFSGLRVYALVKHYPLSILIFLLAAVPFATNIAQIAWDVGGVDIAPAGCVELISISEAVYNKLLVITRTCVIASDLLVVLSTLWAISGRSGGLLRRDAFRRSGATLFGVIFHDGMIYFLVLSVLNSIDIGLSLSASSNFVGSSASTFIDPITSILVSTFLLDLQEAHQRMCRVDSDDPLYSERNNSLVFARVIGSLGASIEPGMSASDDFEDEDDDAMILSDQQEDYVAGDERDIVATASDEQDRTQA